MTLTNGGKPQYPTGKAARRGTWIQKPDSAVPGLSTLRIRQAAAVKRTYTSVVKVPVQKYMSATPEEQEEKKARICEEKKASSVKMEKRIKRFCHAYRLPNPDPNSHSTIAKEAPWLTSRADDTEHTHIIHATLPGAGDEENESNTVPLNIRQCHYFYKDTSITSWRVATNQDGEIARLKASTNNTSFREYAWRLSYIVCQGKREMRLMAKDKNEKCGPLPLFSKHSLVKDLVFELPEDKDAYKHEPIPISRAVRMMFQTADMAAFAKQAAVKKGIPGETALKLDVDVEDVDLAFDDETELTDEDSDSAISLKTTGGKLRISKRKKKGGSSGSVPDEQKEETEVEPEPEEEQDLEDKGDNYSNNGQEEEAQLDKPEPEPEKVTPEPSHFPSPVIPETPTPPPAARAPSAEKTKKCGCCAFL